ncbi:MAG: hypothetical protein IJY12_04985 [Clostridia bacterium]|nr:hypothetical protein [Clostridia bacterium]
MNKIVSIILLCCLILLCFSGCSTDGKDHTTPAIIEGELDKSSDLVVTLIAYLEQYLVDYDLIGRSFFQKVDDIKSGIQPLHVAFDPSNYYFVCGYYNSVQEHNEFGYCCAKDYTWVGYKNVAEIQEYYKDMKWAVVFQINKALTITDILSSKSAVPNIEHFQIYKPTFENGVNIGSPLVFNGTFIYLNYPNCYLNRFSQNTDTMYYCKSIYYHPMNTIPCVCLDGEYYLSFHLYTVYSDGQRNESNDYAYSFGQYYDTLMNIMEKDKYNLTDEYGRTSFYGTISFDDFVNGVLK